MVITKEQFHAHFKIDGQKIRQTNPIKYLESVIDCKGDEEYDINNKLSTSSKLFNALKTTFFWGERNEKRDKSYIL